MGSVSAITFDLWDTLVIDDSDEARRRKLGLPTKVVARRDAFVRAVGAAHPQLALDQVYGAWEAAQVECRRRWHEDRVTPTVVERVELALVQLGVGKRIPGFLEVVEEIEGMEVFITPLAAPAVYKALEALHGRYPLGIVSDAIITPGRGLRQILDQLDMLHYFDVFIFSDEVGASKPDPQVFALAAHEFNISAQRIVHIGDREERDIEGPLAAGARGLLYTGVQDRSGPASRASARFAHYAELPGIIEQLDRQG